MRTVKALALVNGNTLFRAYAIFHNSEVVELPVTPRRWETHRLLEEHIKKVLRQNHLTVARHELANSYVYNIYYIDMAKFTVGRRLS